jgi:dipeptidase E
MKLLLTSSGNRNESIENALLDLMAKPFAKSNLLYVPTAANPEKGDKSWLVDDMYNFRKLNFASFNMIDIAGKPLDILLPSFKNADVLVFGGGDCYYLLEYIRKSGLEKMLKSLIKTRVYVGISAGSMITANHVSISTDGILYYEKHRKFKDKAGLGFVEFEIRPHLNSAWFPKVRLPYLEKLAKDIPYSFYAIDDQTAIKVIDNKIEIVSEGEWKKFN